MDSKEWYDDYEERLEGVLPNLEAIAELFIRLRSERNFTFAVVKQLMIDSGKYDVHFAPEDLKATDDIKLQFIWDGEGYSYSLIFPGQDAQEVS